VINGPQTPMWAPWVYGDEGVPLDDQAECYHEASKLSPNALDTRIPGVSLLAKSPELRASAIRAVKRQAHLPSVRLPAPTFPPISFEAVIDARRSERVLSREALALDQVSTLLYAAYGITHSQRDGGQPLRAVPSAGALYPLEIYPVALSVAELEPALYHFDPLRGVLERLRSGDSQLELETLTVFPELFGAAAIVFFVTAMFWRSRFKYGLRGYRFALLEAGHVGQNLVLTATALGLASVPVGGFYDRRVETFLGTDGVNEAPLYAVAVGPAASGE
jgi:SagB-type dehydrogenase family enzyme